MTDLDSLKVGDRFTDVVVLFKTSDGVMREVSLVGDFGPLKVAAIDDETVTFQADPTDDFAPMGYRALRRNIVSLTRQPQ